MAKRKKEKTLMAKLILRAIGVFLLIMPMLLIVSCFFFDAKDSAYNVATSRQVSNALGFFGAKSADFVLTWFGLSLPLFLIAPIVWGYDLLRLREFLHKYVRMFAFVLGIISGSIFLNLLSTYFMVANLGGLVGLHLSRYVNSFINNIYAFSYSKATIATVLLILSFMSFNFAVGITIKGWYLLAKRTSLALWKILLLVKYIPLKRIPQQEEKPRKSVKEKAKIERKEPKIKEEKTEPILSAPKVEKMVLNKPMVDSDYIKPSIDLLMVKNSKATTQVSQKELDRIAGELEAVLQEFGVNGKIVNIRPGPVVTLYELEPAPGTKTARVVGLADDIARSMSAKSVRIAVVSGSNTIGIEMPNPTREMVYLRELLESKEFVDSKTHLTITLGKDIGGKNVYADLAKMPHLLVAGTTGSGKSVGVNTMILSLLYRLSPEECKLIMIDPKMLEFSLYNGIPHLLTPVITDPAKAVIGLKWAVREMEDRYRAMAQLNVRNISGYNQKLAEIKQSGKACKRTVQTGFDMDTGKPIFEEQDLDLTPLPYIVIVVDEMADLMLVAGKDVEAAIQRLAQMARAAGIHLIMSTQRPSVDVITGTIKANFPTRISFQVTSKIDSRTILGEQGAEQLLGMGDMLYMPAGQRPVRIHASFVKDSEIESIVEFLKSQKEPQYIEAVTEGELNEKSSSSGAVFDKGEFGGGGEEDLYQQAVDIVRTDKKASTSYIQRKLRIGYNRAASLIDRMETEGVVSSADHVGRREIL